MVESAYIEKIKYAVNNSFYMTENDIDKEILNEISDISFKKLKSEYNNLIDRMEVIFPGKKIEHEDKVKINKPFKLNKKGNIFKKFIMLFLKNINIEFKIKAKINIIYPEKINFDREHQYNVRYLKDLISENFNTVTNTLKTEYKEIMYQKMFVDKGIKVTVTDIHIEI